MQHLSRNLRWFLVALSFLLLASIPLGVFLFNKVRSEPAGDEEVDFDIEEEDESEDDEPVNLLELVTCFELGQTFRAYWDCLVEGSPGDPKDPPSRDPAVFRLRKSNLSEKAKPKGKRRVRRANSVQQYSPLDPEMVFTFIPLDHKFWRDEELRQPINDYVKQFGSSTSPYLYNFVRDTTVQSNPPWSYHGAIPPKDWHKLDIEKFFAPLAGEFTSREATFRNLFIERQFYFTQLTVACLFPEGSEAPEWCKDVVESGLAFDSEQLPPWFLFVDRAARIYFSSDELINKVLPPKPSNREAELAYDQIPNKYFGGFSELNFEEYINHTRLYKLGHPVVRNELTFDKEKDIPSRGYYSSMRYLLPPYISDKELTSLRHNEKAAIPKNFVRANRNNLNLNRFLLHLKQNVFDDKTNTTINENEIEDLIAAASPLIDQLFPDNQFTNVEYMHMAYKVIREDIAHGEAELIHRARYSLPVFPLIYPICRHREPSPINIITDRAIHGPIGPFTLGEQGCRRFRMRVSFPSDGTNVLSLKLDGSTSVFDSRVTLTDGAVRGQTLVFDEMHVHIGTGDTDGSEHRLNGKGFAMELQMIFTLHGSNPNTPYFYTLARQTNDLFAVRESIVLILAVFVEVVAKPENKFLFEPLAQAASKFRMASENKTLEESQFRGYRTKQPVMALREFIPNSVYYTYRGSLTIPPCFPYVIWSVFEKPLQISKEQFAELRLWPTPSTDDTDFLSGNVRKIEDVWVEDEHEPGLTEDEIQQRQDARNFRIVMKSNPKGFNPDYYSPSRSQITSPRFTLIFVTFVNVVILSF